MDESSSLLYHERHSESLQYLYSVKEILYEGRTRFQRVEIVDLDAFGRTLFLDGNIQSSEVDEFVYHEALVHPALLTHPRPETVLILGGGEGATLREVLRHPSVNRAVMVDIDEELVGLCREYLPEFSDGAFDRPGVELVFSDAREYLERAGERFDVVISDLTEPLPGGPSLKLFTKEFFETISDSLSEDGIFVQQAGSVDPVWYPFFADLHRTLESVFPRVRGFQAFILSFQIPWGFILASRGPDPLSLTEADVKRALSDRGIDSLRSYHPALHRSLFGLPLYLLEKLPEGRVLTDDRPFASQA
jgi:spermidine synthase